MTVQLETQIDSWQPINLADLPDKPPVTPNLGNTGLIYPGKRHVFSGPPESAKTLAAYCILIQTAAAGGNALLIDFEMGAYDARQRLYELGATPDQINRILYLEPDTPATPHTINNLIEYNPDLVVIDAAAGAYELQNYDDNKRGDVQKLSSLYIGIFWHNGIATITIDHVVKDTETRGRYAIGSERKLGSADVHYGFDTITPISRGTAGKYKLTTHKDRAGYMKRGHFADLQLESDPETHQIAWTFTEAQTTSDEGYFRPTHLMEKASIDLEHRTEPVSRNQVCLAVGGTKEYVLKALDALVRELYVTETDGPNRSKLLTSERRYREADDAQESTSSPVVRTLFASSSANQSVSGGSVVRPPYGDDTTRPPTSRPPEQLGWFGDNGHLQDTDLAWLDELTPDPEDDS